MERYSHLQAMPNSPLTPLTPLSENTKFEFNFGGDGSLDEYINSVRQGHLVEQQQKKLLQHANRTFNEKLCPLQPKRYSEGFRKIRDVFETRELNQGQHKIKQNNCQGDCRQQKQQHLKTCIVTSKKAPIVKITYAGSKTAPTSAEQILNSDYARAPPSLRTPLKPQNLNSKFSSAQHQLKLEQKHAMQQKNLPSNENRIFQKASPVAAKPICPQVANILRQRGLSMYCGLLQREEIDLFTFHMLKLQDLHNMGITNKKHCAILMQEICLAGQYF